MMGYPGMPEDAIKPTEEPVGDIIYRHWGMEMPSVDESRGYTEAEANEIFSQIHGG